MKPHRYRWGFSYSPVLPIVIQVLCSRSPTCPGCYTRCCSRVWRSKLTNGENQKNSATRRTDRRSQVLCNARLTIGKGVTADYRKGRRKNIARGISHGLGCWLCATSQMAVVAIPARVSNTPRQIRHLLDTILAWYLRPRSTCAPAFQDGS